MLGLGGGDVFSGFIIDLLLQGGKLLAGKAVEEFGKGAGKAAFDALKARLSGDHGVKTVDLIDRLEQTPGLRSTIEAEIEQSGAGKDPELLALAETLRAAIEELPEATQVAYAIEGGTFKAGKDIIARQVEGMRNVDMEAGGNMDFSGARAPGKR